MDKDLELKLHELTHKHISALTESDLAFLRARRSYLGKGTEKKLAKLLDAKPVVVKVKGASKKEMKRLAHPAAL